jgi:hypothetical protein
MLEQYFLRPTTVDRIRSNWLGPQIELYVEWMHGTRERTADGTKPGREIRHASTSNLSPSTTAVATSRTRCTQGFLSNEFVLF